MVEPAFRAGGEALGGGSLSHCQFRPHAEDAKDAKVRFGFEAGPCVAHFADLA